MNRIAKYIFGVVVLCLLVSPSFAQQNSNAQHEVDAFEQYDPLTPQPFAFDKKNQLFVGINKVDNSIDIIRYENDQLNREKSILVDVFEKRHDVHRIYRPQSVAIYDNYIVYLASHRDSCFLAVLDIQGNLVKKLSFPGNAFAFSYSPSSSELYIAGDSKEGYDVVAIDTKNGFENIENAKTPSLHYKRPKKAEEILEKDPYGAGIAAVAMSVVFLVLLTLFLVFKQLGKSVTAAQQRKTNKAAKAEAKAAATTGTATVAPTVLEAGMLSGEQLAAIATAIYMYNSELHDEENTVLTINKVSRNYSPWSSKIYGLNSYFNRR